MTLFKSSSFTKTKLTTIFLQTQKTQFWQPLFCVEICTRFRPPFRIWESPKCFKRAICFLFLRLLRRGGTHQRYISSSRLTPNNPYLGVGDENPNYVQKSTLDYPKITCKSSFNNSECVVGQLLCPPPHMYTVVSLKFVLQEGIDKHIGHDIPTTISKLIAIDLIFVVWRKLCVLLSLELGADKKKSY